MGKLNNLFKPIKIGDLDVKNRIMMSPCHTFLGNGDKPDDDFREFYAEIARGGAGLITVGMVSPTDLIGSDTYPTYVGLLEMSMHTDEYIPEWKKLTDAIHAEGSTAMVQLGLRFLWGRDGKNLDIVGPSGRMLFGAFPMRALTVDEIREIVDEYGEAARRAREAGFDAVEIQVVGGYLNHAFLTPLLNKRTDEYGGCLENRMRLFEEILSSMKEKAGKDYVYTVRLTVDDYIEGGNTLEDMKIVAARMEALGVKMIDVMGMIPEYDMSYYVAAEGSFVHLSEGIKQVVRIPVASSISYRHSAIMDKLIGEGKTDMISMTRGLFADPNLPNKAKEGRLEDIAVCLSCCNCLDKGVSGQPISCAINPRTGRELKLPLQPKTENPKDVWVIGGGPGGMNAAIYAFDKGHKVTLFEKQEQLGGLMKEAAVPPHKEPIGEYIEYLKTQIFKREINVCLGKKATAEEILAANPGAVIVAAGADPKNPAFNKTEDASVVNVIDVLDGAVEIGKEVVVVGGGMVGCEAALFLAEQGKKVTIIEQEAAIGWNMGATTGPTTQGRIQAAGIKVCVNSKLENITVSGVGFMSGEEKQIVAADTVVVAVGFNPRKELEEQLANKINNLFFIGDCVNIGQINDATSGAYHAVRQI
jgi:2,4-dienoyl-CoA reductase (NADPH2)